MPLQVINDMFKNVDTMVQPYNGLTMCKVSGRTLSLVDDGDYGHRTLTIKMRH